MTRRQILKSRLLWAAPLTLIAMVGIGTAAKMTASLPEDLDFSLTRYSDAGLYETRLDTDTKPVSIGVMHVFTVTLKTRDGKPVEKAALTIDGGMPQHGHGLPTRPRVTADLGLGRYRVEGIKFNMPGWWTVTVHATSGAGSDETTFNLKL
ncbi:FixH family protein [Sinorhizobium chiapasense]|uniref:FixH family protein n=1 Tax=Sinorhizobium chiapasense TaxID=501572 RepID=A0ABZ2B975_9HYPH